MHHTIKALSTYIIVFGVSVLVISCSRKQKQVSHINYTQLVGRADSLLRILPDSSFKLYSLILADSTQAGPVVYIRALISISELYSNRGLNDTAQVLASKAGQLALRQADTNLMMHSHLLSGNLHVELNLLKEALQHYREGLALAIVGNFTNDENSFLIGIGNIQLSQADYTAAFASYSEAAAAAHKSVQISKEATAYINMALVMKYQDDFREALRFGNIALSLDNRSGQQLDHAQHLLNVGVFYENLEKPDSALLFYKQAGGIFEKAGDSMMMIKVLFNSSNVIITKRKYQQAIRDMNTVLSYCTRHNVTEGRVFALTMLANIYSKTGHAATALQAADSAIDIARKNGIINSLAGIYESRSLALQSLGRYQEALNTVLLSRSFSDSINTVQKQKEITSLRVKFDTGQKESEIEKLSLKILTDRQTRRLQNFIIALLSLLFVGSAAVTGYVWSLLKARTSAYKALQSFYSGRSMPAVPFEPVHGHIPRQMNLR